MTKPTLHIQFSKKWNHAKEINEHLALLKSTILSLYINKELIEFLEFLLKDLLQPEGKVFMLKFCQKIILQYPRYPKGNQVKAFELEYAHEREDIEEEQQLFQPSIWCEIEIKYLESVEGHQTEVAIKRSKADTGIAKENDWLTLEETMRLLKMSKSTIDRRCAEGMPRHKTGKKIFFMRSEIFKWMKDSNM